MASSLQGQNTGGGGSRRRVVRASTRAGGRSSTAAVKQLLSKLRRTWRRRVTRPRRPALSFSYDPHSYSQNFDDGHHRLYYGQ
ncbi:hypothetical protein U9M48_009386 [Paspalum notatum var. saurae]|uniref:Uncharacterized protein n=1 Tax=Paspalum notatum var. saurae TaxID=547442 RepID=A0AAQ3WEW7_PASNO